MLEPTLLDGCKHIVRFQFWALVSEIEKMHNMQPLTQLSSCDMKQLHTSNTLIYFSIEYYSS